MTTTTNSAKTTYKGFEIFFETRWGGEWIARKGILRLKGDSPEAVMNLVDRDIADQKAVIIRDVNGEDITKFINAYKAHRATVGYSDEERYEMRAAFGDEQVVDIFTGKTI